MSRTFRQRQQPRSQDRMWLYAMGIVVVLMLAVVLWRWNDDRQPPQVRLGVPQVETETTGGQVVVPLNEVPQLGADGGVVAIRAGSVRTFVVRLTADHYEAYADESVKGRPLRYDVERGMFVSQKNPDIGFDRATGECLTPDVEDRIPRYLTRVTASTIEIVTQAQ